MPYYILPTPPKLNLTVHYRGWRIEVYSDALAIITDGGQKCFKVKGDTDTKELIEICKRKIERLNQ